MDAFLIFFIFTKCLRLHQDSLPRCIFPQRGNECHFLQSYLGSLVYFVFKIHFNNTWIFGVLVVFNVNILSLNIGSSKLCTDTTKEEMHLWNMGPVCAHIAALCPRAVRDFKVASSMSSLDVCSLLQISVHLKAVVSRVGHSHVSIWGEGEALGSIQRVCWSVDIR